MITFFISLVLLIVGYATYGKLVEKAFKPDDRPTPAKELADGVDFVEMKPWRIFLVQLLNIAGLGPIFGAIMGALWGPVVFLWIVFGTIFAGAVHDFLSGMISIRHKGASISEIVGIYLGPQMKMVMRVFSVVLLVLVGTVFMTGPAGLLARLTPDFMDRNFWLIIVLVYYFLATILPIDALIGRIYPLFGAALIIMALGIAGGMLFTGVPMMELTLSNLHPAELPIWPLMFVTVACGAISGFHATQSPMMARCMTSERDGRKIFYGAMVAEGVIALIWAAAGVSFYGATGGLATALAEYGGQAGVVYDISFKLLGPVGGVLAMVGVIACPITSGDTAFRSARLTLADWFNLEQKSNKSRLLLAVPLLGVGGMLTLIDFNIVWRYFSWSNQTLAMIALWAGAMYLVKQASNHWIATVPATFMSAVSMTYILQAPEGFKLPTSISYPVGIALAMICLFAFLFKAGIIGKAKVVVE